MTKPSASVPDGFSEMRPYGQFHELLGPMFMARRGDNVVVGLRVDERHGNAIGTLHGGMFMTLVDTALTLAAGRAAPNGQYAVTQGMSADFLSAAQEGDWIEAEVEVLRTGRTTISLDCRVRKDDADGKLLMRASGTFHVIVGK